MDCGTELTVKTNFLHLSTGKGILYFFPVSYLFPALVDSCCKILKYQTWNHIAWVDSTSRLCTCFASELNAYAFLPTPPTWLTDYRFLTLYDHSCRIGHQMNNISFHLLVGLKLFTYVTRRIEACPHSPSQLTIPTSVICYVCTSIYDGFRLDFRVDTSGDFISISLEPLLIWNFELF